MQENLRTKESDRALRIARSHDPSINSDRSVDARKCLTPPTPRVRYLQTSGSTANGQYTKVSSALVKSRLITYKYLPNHVFRKYNDNTEIAVLERIDGDWFTCEGIILTSSEIQSCKAFQGSIGLDIDALMKRKKRKAIASSVKTVNDRGRCTYKCNNATYDDVEKNLLDREIRMHNAKKQKSLMKNVEMINVKRKK